MSDSYNSRSGSFRELPPESAIPGVVFRSLRPFRDNRGWLIELYRMDELVETDAPVMAYVSETLPGVCRGPHEHVEQSDLFAFVGPGDFRLRLWDARVGSVTYRCVTTHIVGQSNPQSVLVPPGVVHGYKNISDIPGWVFNSPNALYRGVGKKDEVDEIRHEEMSGSPYSLE